MLLQCAGWATPNIMLWKREETNEIYGSGSDWGEFMSHMSGQTYTTSISITKKKTIISVSRLK